MDQVCLSEEAYLQMTARRADGDSLRPTTPCMRSPTHESSNRSCESIDYVVCQPSQGENPQSTAARHQRFEPSLRLDATSAEHHWASDSHALSVNCVDITIMVRSTQMPNYSIKASPAALSLLTAVPAWLRLHIRGICPCHSPSPMHLVRAHPLPS